MSGYDLGHSTPSLALQTFLFKVLEVSLLQCCWLCIPPCLGTPQDAPENVKAVVKDIWVSYSHKETHPWRSGGENGLWDRRYYKVHLIEAPINGSIESAWF